MTDRLARDSSGAILVNLENLDKTVVAQQVFSDADIRPCTQFITFWCNLLQSLVFPMQYPVSLISTPLQQIKSQLGIFLFWVCNVMYINPIIYPSPAQPCFQFSETLVLLKRISLKTFSFPQKLSLSPNYFELFLIISAALLNPVPLQVLLNPVSSPHSSPEPCSSPSSPELCLLINHVSSPSSLEPCLLSQLTRTLSPCFLSKFSRTQSPLLAFSNFVLSPCFPEPCLLFIPPKSCFL